MELRGLDELLGVMTQAQKEIGYPTLIGLPLPVVFMGNFARAGCAVLTLDEWKIIDKNCFVPKAGRRIVHAIDPYRTALVQFAEALNMVRS
jgi:hypothetical protein